MLVLFLKLDCFFVINVGTLPTLILQSTRLVRRKNRNTVVTAVFLIVSLLSLFIVISYWLIT